MTNLQLDQASKQATYNKSYANSEEVRIGFIKGACWHESLPLADRLSESEKEKLRGIYNAGVESMDHYRQVCKNAKNNIQEAVADTLFNSQLERVKLLINIFGKDLFTKSE